MDNIDIIIDRGKEKKFPVITLLFIINYIIMFYLFNIYMLLE